MEYNFKKIEQHWQEHWKVNNTYKVSNDSARPPYYVLDMFPYPSGAGLHVGHPLGYIASDIYSRYKRLKGYNVLHPMGYDSFGLPAEQYALETGQHPAITTEKNIATFRSQLDKIGFSYDWSREVRTSDPNYYRWTQWIFLQLFKSWYNPSTDKAEPIDSLIKFFEAKGSYPANTEQTHWNTFTAEQWLQFNFKKQQEILMNYRLAYSSYGEVNWCEVLGTVLANDEVVNGISERGGHPVVKKKMRQWYLRITKYADRLLKGLETVAFSDAMKEMQKNWIGKSEGAVMEFWIADSELKVEVYTTRPDTIFGVDFIVLAPEHDLVKTISTNEQRPAIDEYFEYAKSRSDRERITEVKQITGCFTGAFALHPFNGKKIPVWIAEYVLVGYGTGAIMAVPCGDQRDYEFATHFNIPITNIIGEHFNGKEANPTKDAVLQNSGFLDGLFMKDAIGEAINKMIEIGIGKRKVNYRMRDAGFSRQRYWGEPFPVIWNDGIAIPADENKLPLELPYIEKYGPGPNGEGPLANLTEWVNRETSTMPGYAGSSWYFLRYMDPGNNETFCDRKASDYWGQVDVYIGGTEHAVGHLLYSRMWTKFLYDRDWIGFDEPFKKLVNQGMIQGSSRFVYRIKGMNKFVSFGLKENYESDPLYVDVNIVEGTELNIEQFKKWKPEFANAEFILEYGSISSPVGGARLPDGQGREVAGKYLCGTQTEKMSKRLYNTVNPTDIVEAYGADTFRMYEMFLGPVEQSKPWDTKGIEGVHRFLRKLWRLFYDDVKGKQWNEEKANVAELKTLHRTIKKIENDTEQFSFNTAVSAFMVCVNELTDLKCNKKEILEPLLILLAPYAPHITEELWHLTGHPDSIFNETYPKSDEKYLVETSKEYPVSINGKLRTTITIALDASQTEVEQIVLQNDIVQKWVEGRQPKKIIFVKGKMINIVI